METDPVPCVNFILTSCPSHPRFASATGTIVLHRSVGYALGFGVAVLELGLRRWSILSPSILAYPKSAFRKDCRQVRTSRHRPDPIGALHSSDSISCLAKPQITWQSATKVHYYNSHALLCDPQQGQDHFYWSVLATVPRSVRYFHGSVYLPSIPSNRELEHINIQEQGLLYWHTRFPIPKKSRTHTLDPH